MVNCGEFVVVVVVMKNTPRFWDLFFLFLRTVCCRGTGIPQGLKPHSFGMMERPKAEALGYLDAEADPLRG